MKNGGKMNVDEYRALCNTGNTRSLRQDDPKTKIHKRALQALCTIQNLCRSFVSPRKTPFGIAIKTENKRADIDNLAKSVLDGLNKIAFVDDKQCEAIIIYKNGSEHILLEMIDDLLIELGGLKR